jgi:hypothetical protein
MPSGARRSGIGAPRISLIALVAQDLVLAAGELHRIAIALAEGVDLLRIGRVERLEHAAAAEHRVGHRIDVRVIEADHAEIGLVRHARLGPDRGGILRRRIARALRLGEHFGRQHRGDAGHAQDRTAVHLALPHCAGVAAVFQLIT